MATMRARCSTQKGSAWLCSDHWFAWTIHPSAKKQTASLLCLDLFGPSVLLLQRSYCFWWCRSFCRDRIFLQSYADSGILRTCLQMVASPTQKEARGCFHTAGRVWGVSSGSVTLFVSCEATEWPRLQEDAFQGVWGQPTWLHRWMTVRRWAMCLLGAFCSGRDASGLVAVDGTSDAYWEGRPFNKFCLISVSVRILRCLLKFLHACNARLSDHTMPFCGLRFHLAQGRRAPMDIWYFDEGM